MVQKDCRPDTVPLLEAHYFFENTSLKLSYTKVVKLTSHTTMDKLDLLALVASNEKECKKPNARMHFRGSLSMAKRSVPDSGGPQFSPLCLPAGDSSNRRRRVDEQ